MAGGKRGIGPEEAARIKRLLQTYSQQDVAAITKRSASTISRLAARGFVPSFTRCIRPCPDDWAFVSGKMEKRDLCKHYKAGINSVNRWIAEKGRKFTPTPINPNPKMPIPSDLAEVMARMTCEQAAKHYGVNSNTVVKWRRAAGLPIRVTKKTKVEKPQFPWWERKAA